MAHFASDSAIPVPAGSTLEKSIQDCQSVSEIQTLLHAEAARLRLIEKDPFDSDGKDYFSYKPVVAGSAGAAKGYAKTLVVDGRKIILESDTEAGLIQEELKVMRSLFEKPAAAVQEEQVSQPRNERGQFITHDPSAVALAPTIALALEAQGISVDELREFTETRRGDKYINAWQTAAEQFQNSPEGADWVGNSENFKLMQDLIIANPELMDKPSVETIALIWNHMKENHLNTEDIAVVEARELAAASSPDELQNLLRSRGHLAPLDSNLWGR